ncbi:MAG: glutamate--tRNA ligase [Gemmatimonadota bacterium]
MSLRVRFAPSPTGYLHVGGARTDLFNWLLALGGQGTFILRIDDNARARSTPEMVEAILDGMRWLGLDWDEGPYFQAEGVERHREEALRLLDKGRAYRDFTTPEELAEVRENDPDRVVRYPRERAKALGPEEAESRAAGGEPHAIRFRIPEGETVWEDRVHGTTRFRNADIEDLVILRSDGSPTYNLAVVSDDAHMRIDLVMRGDDHLSNTPKQILLYEALGHPVPEFAHLPMILGPDGKRLSKRHGATAVGDYSRLGILGEAMVNFLAFLGWSPGTDEEVMTREELVQRFSLDRVLRKSAVFDPQKLEWINGRHLAAADGESLVGEVMAHLGDARSAAEARLEDDREWFLRLLELLKDRARSVGEIALKMRPYLLEELHYDPGAVRKHWLRDPVSSRSHLEALHDRLERADWEEAPLERELRSLAEERGVGAGKLIHPLRVALVGEAASPGIFEVLVLLGRARSLSRIAAGAARIREAPESAGTDVS